MADENVPFRNTFASRDVHVHRWVLQYCYLVDFHSKYADALDFYLSTHVWVRYFVWNFKGTLWNSTQNILAMHRHTWFLYNFENLRAPKFTISQTFLNPDTEDRIRHISVATLKQLEFSSIKTYMPGILSSHVSMCCALHLRLISISGLSVKQLWDRIYGTVRCCR